MHACMHIFIYACICAHTYAFMYESLHACIYTFKHALMYECKKKNEFTSELYVRLHEYMYSSSCM